MHVGYAVWVGLLFGWVILVIICEVKAWGGRVWRVFPSSMVPVFIRQNTQACSVASIFRAVRCS